MASGVDYYCENCGVWMFWSSLPTIGQRRCDHCSFLNVLDAANQRPTFVSPPQPSNVPTSDSRFQDT